MRSTKAFLIGFGAAYLFDPDQGRRRRTVARERVLKLIRRTARLGQKKARFTGGRLRGLAARARSLVWHPGVAVDDRTVEQRIRSAALRDVGPLADRGPGGGRERCRHAARIGRQSFTCRRSRHPRREGAGRARRRGDDPRHGRDFVNAASSYGAWRLVGGTELVLDCERDEAAR